MIFHPTDLELQRANIYLKAIFEKGKKAKIEPIAGVKTISQNSYIWLVFTHIGAETGNTKEDIYQFCLKEFPVFKEIIICDELELIPVTLSGFSKEQTSHFIDQVVTYFRVEGYDIPDPEDIRCQQMYQYYRDRGLL